MKKTITPSNECRFFLRRNKNAVLSTFSVDVDGFPFGSVCPYILDHQGRPVILISAIAQHTKNILRDPRVCLTVMDESKTNRLEGARVSLMGKALLVEKKNLLDVSARYLRFFPESRSFFDAHDFNYYTIDPLRVRTIEGFAKIYWVEREEFLLKETELAKSEQDMLVHMNNDHLDALKKYYQWATGQTPKTIELIAIDPEGFNLRSDLSDEYIRFESPSKTAQDVRNQMILIQKNIRNLKLQIPIHKPQTIPKFQ